MHGPPAPPEKGANAWMQAGGTAGEEPRYRIAVHVHFAFFDDTAILLDTRSGKYLHLNEAGTRILQFLQGHRQPADIVEKLAAEFDVGRQVAAEDLARFLAELEERGLVYRIDHQLRLGKEF